MFVEVNNERSAGWARECEYIVANILLARRRITWLQRYMTICIDLERFAGIKIQKNLAVCQSYSEIFIDPYYSCPNCSEWSHFRWRTYAFKFRGTGRIHNSVEIHVQFRLRPTRHIQSILNPDPYFHSSLFFAYLHNCFCLGLDEPVNVVVETLSQYCPV